MASSFYNKAEQDRFIAAMKNLDPRMVQGVPMTEKEAQSVYFVEVNGNGIYGLDLSDFAPDDLIAIQYGRDDYYRGLSFSAPVVTFAVCAFEKLRRGSINFRYARIRRGNLKVGVNSQRFTEYSADIEWNQFTDLSAQFLHNFNRDQEVKARSESSRTRSSYGSTPYSYESAYHRSFEQQHLGTKAADWSDIKFDDSTDYIVRGNEDVN